MPQLKKGVLPHLQHKELTQLIK